MANLWRTERDEISAIKFEEERLHFLSDVFVAVALVVVYKLPISLRSMAVLSSRAKARSGVATKNSRAKRARTSGEAARKIIILKLLRLQSPRDFSALTGLYYLVRPTKTARVWRV